MFAPVYLDHNATAPLDEAVFEAMLPWLGTRFGNASSRHEYGRQARAALDEARARVAAAVGAHPTEVVFTSGGSEANNLFLKGVAATRRPARLAVSRVEHPCVFEPARQLERAGWQLDLIGVDADGRLREDDVCAALAARPAMVSVMLAHNETGALHDVAALAPRVRAAGGWLHTDAVQALGKIALDFRALGVQAMTLSAHKIGGPLGAGALVLDKRVELAPLVAGGGQERGLRSGTENIAALVGFGVAAELAVARQAESAARLSQLRDRLEAEVSALGATVFARGVPRLPNTLFFALPAVDGETLVARLDRAGFACASGSACSSADPQPSRSLLAMGVAPDLARGALRVSLGPRNTLQDIERFAATLRQVVHELKTLTALAV